MNFDQAELRHIILHHNWMYWHKIIKFNYTMYNMWWEQDVLNPGTSNCNFMALAPLNSDEISNEHPFMYGWALSVFHINMIYNGPKMLDYKPRCFDFLWVCWCGLETPPSQHKRAASKLGAHSYCLDWLVFPSLDEEDSIGFLDPADILHASHIIPTFTKGKHMPDNGAVLSKCAREHRDWNMYYISWSGQIAFSRN